MPIDPDVQKVLDGINKRLDGIDGRVASQTEGLRRVVEGRYSGADGAAGKVVELEGGNTTISPQPDFTDAASKTPLAVPWSRVELIGCGFTPAADVMRIFGVKRTIIKAVAHDTQGDTIAGALATWNNSCQAGAQLVIGCGKGGDGDGECVMAVQLEDVAWHAGTNQDTGRDSFWQVHNVNPFSVGIEFCGFAGQPYTDAQYAKGNEIARWLESVYAIPRVQTPALSPGWIDHASISNQRSDPGPTFSWARILA